MIVLSVNSVGVVGDEGAGAVAGTTLVNTLGSGTVSSGTFEERSLSSLNIFSFALPCLEHTLLESAAVGEGEGPWLLNTLKSIHGIKVEGGIFL